MKFAIVINTYVRINKDVIDYFDEHSKTNRFEEYKKKQKEYIELIKSLWDISNIV